MVYRFFKDERGAISPLMLVMLIGILLTTGVAIDLIKHEGARADLQAALDRGVLAAASLQQGQDVQEVVRSYIDNGVPFSDDVSLNIDATTSRNRREIKAVASYDSDTIFLSFVGLDELLVPAASTAVEGRENIEISLVLDRSGSMGPRYKIGTLREAATSFIDIVEASYGDGQRATINLIPFSAGTSVGPDVFNFLGVRRVNQFSSCAWFAEGHYADSGLPQQGQMTQAARNLNEDCPPDREAITFISGDYNGLRQTIGGLSAYGWTGTYIAMKWALALLDPETRTRQDYQFANNGVRISFTDYLLTTGQMDRLASDRPVAWDDTETLKVIVVMTDGQINPPTSRFWRKTPSVAEGVRRFLQTCDLARQRNVLVYTIAFAAPRVAKDQMRQCASTPSTFFDVQGQDLITAFEQIASEITKLQLTQ